MANAERSCRGRTISNQPIPTAWDDLTVDAARDLNLLAAFGRDGWELVTISGDSPAYFRRPAPSFRERVTLQQKRRFYQQLGRPFTEGGAKTDLSGVAK